MVLRAPSSSLMPLRFPEKVITLGTPPWPQAECSCAGCLDIRMMFQAVHGIGNGARVYVAHGAGEPVAVRHLVLFRIEQVNADQTHLRRFGAQGFKRNLA